jgi:enoyl-CoA hydratase
VTTPDAPEVLLRREAGIGRITLNRPRAINALNHAMVRTITGALTEWEHDDTVATVVLDGAGDRGMCAGGDIRAIYQDATSGGSASLSFWIDEYRLNSQIAHYRKPFVAMMDGLVMGGGVGLSAHASHRVVTDRTVVGMPEVNIGLIPDVGGTYLLARAPGHTGLHLALTGGSITGVDAIAMNLADRFIDHREQADLIAQINERGAAAALATLPSESSAGPVLADRQWIDSCYAPDSVEAILVRLRSHPSDAAQRAAAAIAAAAPTSVKLTHRAVRAARTLGLEASLNQEFRMVSALLRAPDLVEGIRAQVIDKDRNPNWTPATLDEVTPDVLDRYFLATPVTPFGLADAADSTAPLQEAVHDRVPHHSR